MHQLARRTVHVRHDDHELVASQTEHQVRRAEAIAQHLGHPLEHEVANVVPVRVVDQLELVHVHEQQRRVGHVHVTLHDVECLAVEQAG